LSPPLKAFSAGKAFFVVDLRDTHGISSWVGTRMLSTRRPQIDRQKTAGHNANCKYLRITFGRQGLSPNSYKGHHAVTIYTICPDTLREGDWDVLKKDCASKLIDNAEQHIPGLRKHIQVCEVLTPADFRQRTHLNHHAFGGIAPVMATWRVPLQTPLPSLRFVGAQSESGGVNSVVPGAYKTAQRIADSARRGTA
jgi:hypothetical protein